MQNLLSIQEAAAFLGIAKGTLNTWVSKRKIAFTKVGRRTMFNSADLIRFVQTNTVQPNPRNGD